MSYSDYALIKKSTLTNAADAIRAQKGTNELIDPANFGSEIESIEGGVPKEPVLQDKVVARNGVVTPDEGYDGLSSVTIAVTDKENMVNGWTYADCIYNVTGIDKYEYGRDNFLKACWDWTHEYGGNIRDQWGKVGISVDYNKERFTLDEGLNKAVTKVFVDYYNEGIIYRGEKIINWDPQAQTALSNEEVIYKDVKGAFYHIKYMIEGTGDYLEVATTRPETLFGDTAVAVNPKDERYNKLIGKNVVLPIVNKLIPIVGDEHLK